jgi:hypothetical protein
MHCYETNKYITRGFYSQSSRSVQRNCASGIFKGYVYTAIHRIVSSYDLLIVYNMMKKLNTGNTPTYKRIPRFDWCGNVKGIADTFLTIYYIQFRAMDLHRDITIITDLYETN